ncbi:IS1182 family transposase [Pseudenhygromyxa sp. WMMC2535]|uniref:IS1182 family transposase n=1 Tax=Pseudenhygromyxa sp. WMMC2535 TaxID=2712867 RepID=UPI0015541A0F|nr:IS1182 family transposase [Pseudenhygromyxa sp. WMMC2535]NVB37200.1 IS1182 family transposase [Pseudenhygromyxa sp. WMMC2535]NVB39658.1 IS1182 family transposase [Pseudenhygromyxa sp. WMMC2535]NVB41257.1 IS1182 family transposase [Pseudenhygromyxa sp. WMMC2535]NVB42942.1 IS1182 family transposase [Pseudenhygromyxa sp. WMMC2535]NVB43559.1 IS1182 family transposase [Pseudenhygromyxa sp. WMMC2535]
MTLPRWNPPVTLSPREARIRKRVGKKRKLFGFLCDHRLELFDDDFQAELEQMYRDTGAGKNPMPPALLAMALLLQGYSNASDSEAVELAACDARWQLVLGCLGCDDPPFSQGSLFNFRERLIAHDMDRKLLERTRELAKRTGAFDFKKLPKKLDVAVDSSPLRGAGRVEDTFNLLAHAAWKVVLCVAELRARPAELLVDELGIPLLAEPSIKKALDIDWSNPAAKSAALNRLLGQIETLEQWVETNLSSESSKPPLQDQLALLEQLRGQDLEPDPDRGGQRIKRGVAKDRRVSVEDPDMRHGRKTKTKSFNGYKRHVVVSLHTKLILAVTVAPANQPEKDSLPTLVDRVEHLGLELASLHFDRGYIESSDVPELVASGVEVICKPWRQSNGDKFAKTDFSLDFVSQTVTCPGGQTQPMLLGESARFEADVCNACELKPKCTTSDRGRGLRIAANEPLQAKLRVLQRAPRGRARLRQRVVVEHTLAHVGQRQGNRARYLGIRKNEYDSTRAAVLVNLQVIQHELECPKLANAA